MMPLHSIGGHLYYITFIDDFLRKVWIYCLKHKDEAFKMFKEIKALVENQTGKKIKVFRSDNDEEYISNDFIVFFKKEGIKKEMTVTYNPKQNEMVERKNKSIVEVICAMLLNQNFPKFIRGEAINVVIYVQNRVPHQALENKTPKKCSKVSSSMLAISVSLVALYISMC